MNEQQIFKFKQTLIGWDKKSSEDITNIYLKLCSEKSFADNAIDCLNDKECQMAATWLLKHHFEQVGIQSEKISNKIYQQLGNIDEWQSRLHILQSIQFLPVSERLKNNVEMFIRQSLVDLNKFVRAWAYNAYYLLSKQYPIYRKEAEEFLNLGLHDEPASVKARIKHCLKEGY